MDEQAKKRFQQMQEIQRANEILSKKHGQTKQVRHDGYVNLMNKYGTMQDNGERYQFVSEEIASDHYLITNYEGNGLFTKIIDRPAEEAVKKGFKLDIKDEDAETWLKKKMDILDYEQKIATAIKWQRLFGGAIIVMLVDDGRSLADPLDWNSIRSIDELLVFDRSCVQPDYMSLYRWNPNDPNQKSKFGQPEYFDVYSVYGSFRVHESRCLVFKNGILPEKTLNTEYRFWGAPEYHRIKKALQETITSFGNGPKLLDRCVQAIYKMQGLSMMLEEEDGEDRVLKRLATIDMARGLLNSMIIDAEGEDYDFKNIQLSGIKDLLDATCNMLSAVTDIPQTILFGRSPAGMNSTGDSDMENYYNMIERIQNMNMKANGRTLLDLIFLEGKNKGQIQDVPDYTVDFEELWSLSKKEQADVDKVKADTEYVKAQTAQIYMDTQVIDAKEVRDGLKNQNAFDIEDLLEADEIDFEGPQTGYKVPDIAQDLANGELPDELMPENVQEDEQGIIEEENKEDADDIMVGDTDQGVGILTVRDGKILIGKRDDGLGWCGPGGHIKFGETPEEAANRETFEEFGIKPITIVPICENNPSMELYGCQNQFLCTDFEGDVQCIDGEMEEPRWVSPEELSSYPLFKPFQKTIDVFLGELEQGKENST